MLALRPYQEQGIVDVRAAMKAGHRRVLYVLPTGGGKTVIFCILMMRATNRRRRACIVVHRQELMRQAAAKLRQVGVEPGLIQAGSRVVPPNAICVASVQTLVNRLDQYRGAFDFLVFDEAHHAASGTWTTIFEAFPDAYILGVTATPERVDGRGLGDLFETMVLGPDAAWMIQEGYLCDFTAYVSGKGPPDLTGVRSSMGDWSAAQLAAAMSRPELVGDCLQHYRERAHGMPALGFAVSVEHARMMATVFRRGGYRSEAVDGTLDDAVRRERLAGLECGTLDVVWSCELISEGVDIPGVSCIISLRPTQSLGLHLQQLGRGLRPVYADGFDLSTQAGRLAAQAAGPKPRAIILDHAGNCSADRHGLPDWPRKWSLHSGKRSKAPKEIVRSLRTCSKCFALAEGHKLVCPACGSAYPIQFRKPPKRVDGDLVEADRNAPPPEKQKLTEEQMAEATKNCVSLKDFHLVARKLGYKPGWAYGAWQRSLRKRSVDKKTLDRELDARLASVRS